MCQFMHYPVTPDYIHVTLNRTYLHFIQRTQSQVIGKRYAKKYIIIGE